MKILEHPWTIALLLVAGALLAATSPRSILGASPTPTAAPMVAEHLARLVIRNHGEQTIHGRVELPDSVTRAFFVLAHGKQEMVLAPGNATVEIDVEPPAVYPVVLVGGDVTNVDYGPWR